MANITLYTLSRGNSHAALTKAAAAATPAEFVREWIIETKPYTGRVQLDLARLKAQGGITREAGIDYQVARGYNLGRLLIDKWNVPDTKDPSKTLPVTQDNVLDYLPPCVAWMFGLQIETTDLPTANEILAAKNGSGDAGSAT